MVLLSFVINSKIWPSAQSFKKRFYILQINFKNVIVTYITVILCVWSNIYKYLYYL